MRYVSSFLTILLLSSCSDTGNLFKSTHATRKEPYVIFVVDPNDHSSFYYKLYDSLNAHISKINGKHLENIEDAKIEKDFFIGWLQDQFDEEETGLGKKASSTNVNDRTSDEFYLKTPGPFAKDKVSFSVKYKTASIPNEFLYPDLWKKAVGGNGLEDKLSIEKTRFQNGGTFVRTTNGLTDTLYSYGYKLPIDITLNYTNADNIVSHSTFTVSAQTAVYHQLKF